VDFVGWPWGQSGAQAKKCRMLPRHLLRGLGFALGKLFFVFNVFYVSLHKWHG
jgi:hypothetical protein